MEHQFLKFGRLQTTAVLENKKYAEDFGMESLIYAKLVIDLDTIESYRESVDNNGEIEDFTFLETKNGNSYCIDMKFEDFDEIYKEWFTLKDLK